MTEETAPKKPRKPRSDTGKPRAVRRQRTVSLEFLPVELQDRLGDRCAPTYTELLTNADLSERARKEIGRERDKQLLKTVVVAVEEWITRNAEPSAQ